MTEPDEALLWARERMASTWEQDGGPPLAVAAARAGDYDAFLMSEAAAFRAVAAASAERIAELEAHVEELKRQVNMLRRVVGTDKIVPLLDDPD